MQKQAAIIFARTNSKRFPKKVLKKVFLNKTLLEIIILRIRKFLKIKIIVCTSSLKQDEKIIKICKKNKVKYFRGDLNNVFKRTVDCLKKYNLDSFVRVNSDRPFVDYIEIKKMVEKFKKKKFDIISNSKKKKCPKGLICELAKSEIFFNVDKEKLSKTDKEHIFNYFYKNSKSYNIHFVKNRLYEKNYKKNFSVDSKKDLERVKKIYQNLNSFYTPTEKIIKTFKNEI